MSLVLAKVISLFLLVMETIHYQGVVLTFSVEDIFHNPMQYFFLAFLLKQDHLQLVAMGTKWYFKFKGPGCQMQASMFAEEAL